MINKEVYQAYLVNKDPAIKDQVIKQHYNLVVYIAKRFIGKGESLDDLVQVGILGLLKALVLIGRTTAGTPIFLVREGRFL